MNRSPIVEVGLYGRVDVPPSFTGVPPLLPSVGNCVGTGNRSGSVFEFGIVFVDVIIVDGGPSLENVDGNVGEVPPGKYL